MSRPKNDDPDWFEVTEDLWRKEHEVRPKLRLLADHNISKEMVSELRRARVDIKTANEHRVDNLSDEDLFQYAQQRGLVILTTDRDFWSDRRFPVERGGGVIIVDSPPGDVMKCLRSFGLAYGTFAKSFGGYAADGLRIKSQPDRLC